MKYTLLPKCDYIYAANLKNIVIMNYRSLFVLVAALTFAVSCKKQADFVQPSVKVEVSETSYNSVKFTLTPENATQCSYLLTGKEESAPTAEQIFENGVQVKADKASTRTIEDLEQNTGYIIYAAAGNGTTSVVTSAEFATGESPYDIDFKAAYLEGEFYGDWLDFGNDNFYIILSDVGLDENDYPNPDGQFLVIDLYSPLAIDQNNPVPSTGTYDANSSDEEFSINCGYSYYYYTDAEGNECGKVYLSGGKFYISEKDMLYTLEADFTLEDGRAIHCKYEGPFVLPAYNEDNNKLPLLESGLNTTFTGAKATNYGNEYGAYNVAVVFWDMKENENTGNLIAPGYTFKLDLMTDLTDGSIDPGQYVVDAYGTFDPFTYIEGSILEFYSIELPVGSYVQHYAEDGTVDGYGFVNSGTVDVTRDNGVYTFDMNLEMVGGYSLQATYTGEIVIADEQTSAVNSYDRDRRQIRMDRNTNVILK